VRNVRNTLLTPTINAYKTANKDAPDLAIKTTYRFKFPFPCTRNRLAAPLCVFKEFFSRVCPTKKLSLDVGSVFCRIQAFAEEIIMPVDFVKKLILFYGALLNGKTGR
jgi:hypothetical protein